VSLYVRRRSRFFSTRRAHLPAAVFIHTHTGVLMRTRAFRCVYINYDDPFRSRCPRWFPRLPEASSAAIGPRTDAYHGKATMAAHNAPFPVPPRERFSGSPSRKSRGPPTCQLIPAPAVSLRMPSRPLHTKQPASV